MVQEDYMRYELTNSLVDNVLSEEEERFFYILFFSPLFSLVLSKNVKKRPKTELSLSSKNNYRDLNKSNTQYSIYVVK